MSFNEFFEKQTFFQVFQVLRTLNTILLIEKNISERKTPEAVARKSSVKKVFLGISQNS